MPKSDPWVVHKFGGSSVADADCFRRVAAILDSLPPGPLGVVLSACRGVTDALLRLVDLAERQDESFRTELGALRARHATIAQTLLAAESARLYLAGFDRDCHDLEGILQTVKLTRAAARNVSDLIVGYGEIWSTKLFHRFLEERGPAGPDALAGCAPGRRRGMGPPRAGDSMGGVPGEHRRAGARGICRNAD